MNDKEKLEAIKKLTQEVFYIFSTYHKTKIMTFWFIDWFACQQKNEGLNPQTSFL